jgi:NAD(P)-dependent dehydrogenase (short-subunit alcohol dehydrogenase family)
MMKDLKNRVAVITGGGSGMGCSTGNSLARRGAKVILVDLNPESAEEAAAGIRAAGGEALALAQDIGASSLRMAPARLPAGLFASGSITVATALRKSTAAISSFSSRPRICSITAR